MRQKVNGSYVLGFNMFNGSVYDENFPTGICLGHCPSIQKTIGVFYTSEITI